MKGLNGRTFSLLIAGLILVLAVLLGTEAWNRAQRGSVKPAATPAAEQNRGKKGQAAPDQQPQQEQEQAPRSNELLVG